MLMKTMVDQDGPPPCIGQSIEFCQRGQCQGETLLLHDKFLAQGLALQAGQGHEAGHHEGKIASTGVMLLDLFALAHGGVQVLLPAS